ncbi:STAS domain-containing protein [Streptomyces sp. NPDC012825]|uniref:STAS domain-containing protein n=1 Tax=Streptomyces sp. NPDC012825 TaxID=3364851 RepID=UPI003675666A
MRAERIPVLHVTASTPTRGTATADSHSRESPSGPHTGVPGEARPTQGFVQVTKDLLPAHAEADQRRGLRHLRQDLPHPRVVADMRQVTFMDSTGINILIAAHHTLTQAGGWLRLAGTTTAVMRTIGIVGLDSVIDCRETLSQALNG